jgi:hypothetical protein
MLQLLGSYAGRVEAMVDRGRKRDVMLEAEAERLVQRYHNELNAIGGELAAEFTDLLEQLRRFAESLAANDAWWQSVAADIESIAKNCQKRLSSFDYKIQHPPKFARWRDPDGIVHSLPLEIGVRSSVELDYLQSMRPILNACANLRHNPHEVLASIGRNLNVAAELAERAEIHRR